MLGELLLQMGQRESLRRKLVELEERLGPGALGQVLDRLEKIVGELGVAKDVAGPHPTRGEREETVLPAAVPPPATPPRESPKIEIPDPALRDPFADLLANLNLPAVGPAPGGHSISLSPPGGPEKKPEDSPPPRVVKSEPREKAEPEKEAATAAPPREKPVEEKPRPVTPPPAPPPPAPPPPAPPPPVPPPPAREVPAETKRAPVVLPPGFFRKSEAPKEKPPEAPPPRPAEKKAVDVSAFLPKPIVLRSTYPLEPEDVLYLHAVAQIPVEEKAAPEPFILEEKGIESKEFVFALDRGGLRFFLSRLTGKTTNVSKTGMLLLNRKESIHLRGTHYSILNDLRVYGLLLPFEFGSVALGLDDLHAKIDEHVYELRDALEEIVGTKWWEVCVYGLDQKMMQFVAPDGPSSRGGERDGRGGERSRTTGSRIDIKTLERVLNKQKSLAEEIHRHLENLSARSDVDMMVNLSSGSSDDWKPILRASYDVGQPEIYRFNHAINDLQYHHLKYQLIFVLTGDREDFSFQQA